MDIGTVVLMLVALVVGGVAGYWWGRSSSAVAKEKEDMEKQLGQMQRQFESYRMEVNQHFGTTATLINNMTASYRAVFEHLVQGAQRLSATERTQVELEDSVQHLPPETATAMYVPRPLSHSEVEDLEARMYDAEAASFKAVVSSVEQAPAPRFDSSAGRD